MAAQNAQVPYRYLDNVRQDELRVACECTLRGESLCFVGMAGVGKSNVVRILRYKRDIKLQYLGDETDLIHFVVVDATTWEDTPVSLYRLMLTALEEIVYEQNWTVPDKKITAFDEETRLWRSLLQTTHLVCQSLGRKVVFILDDFDRVLQLGPRPMLEQLNVLRSTENREKLSYIMFTKQLPHVLGRNHDLFNGSKFYDLFKLNIYPLGVYSEEDALQMLRHLNGIAVRAGRPVPLAELSQISWLAGRHARLMKILFEAWHGLPPGTSDRVGYFSAMRDVRAECQRILDGLHARERAVASRVAHHAQRPEDEPVIDYLRIRTFFSPNDPLQFFSPLMREYLLGQSGGGNE